MIRFHMFLDRYKYSAEPTVYVPGFSYSFSIFADRNTALEYLPPPTAPEW